MFPGIFMKHPLGDVFVPLFPHFLSVFGTIEISNPEVLSMKKIIVTLSSERLITPSGLTLVGGCTREKRFGQTSQQNDC